MIACLPRVVVVINRSTCVVILSDGHVYELTLIIYGLITLIDCFTRGHSVILLYRVAKG